MNKVLERFDGCKYVEVKAGWNSEVFIAEEKDTVVKFSKTPHDGFRVIAKELTKEQRERLGLVRIYEEESNYEENIFVLEKLLPIRDYNLYLGCENAQLTLNDLHHPGSKVVPLTRLMDKSDPMFEITRKAYLLWRYLKRKGINTNIDLNPSNIMKRKDGTFVLSDPLGSAFNFI